MVANVPSAFNEKVDDYIALRARHGFPVSELDNEDWHDPHRFMYRIRNDSVFFTQAIFVDQGLYRVAPISPVDMDMWDYMANGPADMSLEECHRRTLLAFRGMGKTYGISSLICYRLRRDPTRQIIVISKSEGFAKKTTKFVRKWLGSIWFIRDLAPSGDLDDAATYFTVTGGGINRQHSVSSYGVSGQLEGNRAHTVIYDDGETKGNTKTIDARAGLRTLFNEATNICYPYQPHEEGGPFDPSEIIVLGTPKHEETIYVDLHKQGYVTRSYPLCYPRDDEKVINLAPILRENMTAGRAKPGDCTLPLRFGPHAVAERRALGYSEWSREFMLIADLAETNRYPLRLADLIITNVHREVAPLRIQHGRFDHNGSTAIPTSEIPSHGLGDDRLYRPIYIEKDNWERYSGTKAGLDPAGRGDDRTGLSIISHLTGTLWTHCVLGLPGGTEPEKLEGIATFLRQYNARQVYLETNIDVFGAYQAALEVAIKRLSLRAGEDTRFPDGWSARVEKLRAGGQKETRIIEILEPVISTHRLVLDRSVVTPDRPYDQDNDFQYQLTRISRQPKCLREDGKIDSFSICVQAWLDVLRMDPERSSDSKHKRLLQDALAKLKGFWGSPATKSVLSRS